MLSASSLNGACYLAGQGINFMVQLLLVHLLGKAGFGPIGMAQICIMALLFIAEFGMPSYFIREASIRHNWRAEWHYACRMRTLLALGGAIAIGLFWWVHFAPERQGLGYVLCAIPALLLSTHNPAPLLIAQGKTTRAAIGLLVQWGTYAVMVGGMCALLPAAWLEYGAGMAFSAGYAAMLYVYRRQVQWPEPTAEAATFQPCALIKRSFIVWFPSVLGTLYGLLLTFFVEALTPAILVYFVLGAQLMQGISGVNLQWQRILLSSLSRAHHQQPYATSPMVGEMFRLCAVAILISVLGMLAATLLAAAATHDASLLNDMQSVTLVIAEWLLGILGTLLVTSLMSQHKEALIYRATVRSFSISMGIQLIVAYATGSILWVVLVRLATAIYQLRRFTQGLQASLSPLPWVGAGGILLLGLIPYNNAYAIIVAISCIAACAGLMLYGWRQLVRVRTTGHFYTHSK